MVAPQRPFTNYNPINISKSQLPGFLFNFLATFITIKKIVLAHEGILQFNLLNFMKQYYDQKGWQ